MAYVKLEEKYGMDLSLAGLEKVIRAKDMDHLVAQSNSKKLRHSKRPKQAKG
jgi:hypothetical protein